MNSVRSNLVQSLTQTRCRAMDPKRRTGSRQLPLAIFTAGRQTLAVFRGGRSRRTAHGTTWSAVLLRRRCLRLCLFFRILRPGRRRDLHELAASALTCAPEGTMTPRLDWTSNLEYQAPHKRNQSKRTKHNQVDQTSPRRSRAA